MKTPIRAIVAAALLTVLAGCASTQATSTSPVGNAGPASVGTPSDEASSSPGSTGDMPTAPTSPTSASSPSASDDGAQVPLPPVHSTAANGDRITYVSPDGITVTDDGRILATSVQWGGCQDQPELVVLGQGTGQVVVEVKTVTHSRVGQMCPNIERVGTVKVALIAPLGERKLIDGVTGKAVSTR